MKIDAKHLQERLRYWRDVLGIDRRYQFNCYIVDSAANMPDGFQSAAATMSVTPYFSGEFHVCPWRIDTEDELDETVCHELLHVILKPLEITAEGMEKDRPKLAEWLLERTVEELTTGYMRLHREAQKRRRR